MVPQCVRRVHYRIETALRRMEAAGVVLTSTEDAIIEWGRVAGTPEFKQISALAIDDQVPRVVGVHQFERADVPSMVRVLETYGRYSRRSLDRTQPDSRV